MSPDFVPEEAAVVLKTLTSVLRKRRHNLLTGMSPWGDAPYRTTVYLKDGDVFEFYETQGRPHLHSQLLNFAHWLSAQRKCSVLYLVAPADAATTVDLFTKLKRTGVGLLLRNEDNTLEEALPAKNPAFIVTPDPSLPLGDLKSKVNSCVNKFNDGLRKDGFRDICEIAEHETERVLINASVKGWISLTEVIIRAKDWSDKINALASGTIMQGGRNALITMRPSSSERMIWSLSTLRIPEFTIVASIMCLKLSRRENAAKSQVQAATLMRRSGRSRITASPPRHLKRWMIY